MSIYTGIPTAEEDDQVRLDGRLVGEIGADRTYTARNQKLVWDFQLVQENGQWRIDQPPPGLMVEEYSFGRFYSGYSNYFIGNGIVAGARAHLPAGAAQPVQRRLGADQRPARRAVEVVGSGGHARRSRRRPRPASPR